GYKYNMTDIAAALGQEQLRRVDEFWQVRRRYAAMYTAAFQPMPEIDPPRAAPPGAEHAWHLYPIRLNTQLLTIDRAMFVEEMGRERPRSRAPQRRRTVAQPTKSGEEPRRDFGMKTQPPCRPIRVWRLIVPLLAGLLLVGLPHSRAQGVPTLHFAILGDFGTN